MRRWVVVLASSLSVGCSGRLEAVPERDAEAQGPMPCPADPNAECVSRQFVRVSWYGDDGGLERCECIPSGEVQCTLHDEIFPDAAPPETPIGPSLCQCNVCGPSRVQTRVCIYDPYYGYLSAVDCVE
jgi:hypothetical protein